MLASEQSQSETESVVFYRGVQPGMAEEIVEQLVQPLYLW